MSFAAETDGLGGCPRVISEKPPIPTLWVDTSVVIKLVRIRKGEKLSVLEVDRTLRLRELVLHLVSAGKLLCPTSDQEEEYEAKNLDSEIFAEFSRLSRGVRMNHRLLVQDAQVYCAMNDSCGGRREVILPWRIYFHEDPFRTIEGEKGRRFIVSVKTPVGSPLISLRESVKESSVRGFEKIRQELRAKGQSYDDQLERELNAFGKTFPEYLVRWQSLGNPPRDLYKFMTSDYVRSLPAVKITAQLFADLVTGNQPIMTGDPGDVDLLSTAIPLAHFVLTDKRMERRIRRMGIDREWNTKVYSMSTADDLFAELENLQRAVA